MNSEIFEDLLLTTAFCCMASDGRIDNREITLIQQMCLKSSLFEKLNFQEEIHKRVDSINSKGKLFISDYFYSLETASLTLEEELVLIDFAIRTIRADEQVDYEEVKFFKHIRHRLAISDEKILAVYPDIELFLEADITTDSYLQRITKQYLEQTNLPHFNMAQIESIILDTKQSDQ